MTSPLSRVPGHVLTAFQIDPAATDAASTDNLGLAWGHGIRVGQHALVPAGEHTNFSVTTRETVTVQGVRFARPLRSTDGRSSVGGWGLSAFDSGELSGRVDETVAAALRLADALRDLPMPGIEAETASLTELYQRAEREAWAECDALYGPLGDAGQLQVGHIDMLGTTLYRGSTAPLVTDLVPTASPRPHAYTAVLAAIDGLIYRAVDEGILDRFAYLPELEQLAVRAVTFRRIVSDLHPEATSLSRSRIESVEALVVSRLSATMGA